MNKTQVAKLLNLEPHIEGGYFRQTYKSNIECARFALPPVFKAAHYTASTAIYYLLGAEDISTMHAVSADEIWHFYAGSDSSIYIDLVVVSPDGKNFERVKIGADLANGCIPQFVAPAGWWMGARIASTTQTNGYCAINNSWALAGTTVAPSFEYADFQKGDAQKIAAMCPELKSVILSLG